MVSQLPVVITTTGAKKAAQEVERFTQKSQIAMKGFEKAIIPPSRALLALDKTTRGFKDNLLSTASSLGPVGTGLAVLGTAGLAAAAAIGAVALVGSKIATMIRPAVEFAAAIKAQAATAGVTTDAFQELQFVASQYNITQDAMTDGLKELALRADEFAKTGKGSASEAFERLGFSVADVNAELGDTDALFDIVIKRMGELDTEAEKIRVADEIFGGQGGEQFVRLLEGGADGIARLRREAHELGIVMNASLIENADEARKKLDTLSKVIDVQFNSALVDMAPALVYATELFADFARGMKLTLELFKDIENQGSLKIAEKIDDIDVKAKAAGDRVNKARRDLKELRDALEDPETGSSRRRLLVQAIPRREDELKLLEKDYKDQVAERERLMGIILNRADNEANKSRPNNPVVPDLKDAFVEVDKYAEGIKRLEFEIDQAGRTDLGKKVFSELNSFDLDGVPETDTRVQRVRELVTALNDLEQAQEATKEAERAAQKVSADGIRVTEKYQTAQEAYSAEITNLINLYEQSAISTETYTLAVEGAEERRLRASTSATDGMRRALLDYADAAGDAAGIAQSATESAFSAMEGFAADFAASGKASFADFARSALADLSRVLFRQAVTAPLANSIGNALGGFSFEGLNLFAGGGIMTPSGAASLPIRTYANGGIANTPQISIWGEGRLPEANIPLPDGRSVPVTLSGAGLGNGSGGGMVIQNYNNFNFAGSPAAPGGGLDPKIAEDMAGQIEGLVDQSVKKSLEKYNRPGNFNNRARTY